MERTTAFRPLLVLALGALLLVGCASGPRAPSGGRRVAEVSTRGQEVATGALSLLGRPYQYGGGGPDTFDCSGLVHYVHTALGISVPRTTADQFRAARPVEEGARGAGDLLFFRIDDDKVSHVAIYLGDGRFVHAPQTGRPVETRRLDDPWYRSRLVGIGRLY